jgi:hypothetical protein
MNCPPDAMRAGDYRSGALLETIARELAVRGLDIREHHHSAELVEIAVTNPGDLNRGRVSVGYDGCLTWEYSGDTETRAGIEEIRDIIASVLKSDLRGIRRRADDQASD